MHSILSLNLSSLIWIMGGLFRTVLLIRTSNFNHFQNKRLKSRLLKQEFWNLKRMMGKAANAAFEIQSLALLLSVCLMNSSKKGESIFENVVLAWRTIWKSLWNSISYVILENRRHIITKGGDLHHQPHSHDETKAVQGGQDDSIRLLLLVQIAHHGLRGQVLIYHVSNRWPPPPGAFGGLEKCSFYLGSVKMKAFGFIGEQLCSRSLSQRR